jgi:formamidopyrimidine-DNA glycosylase
MPELPDVEIFRRYFNRTSLNKEIQRVDITVKKMLKGVSTGSLQMNLNNNKFTKTSRHAKYLFAHTDNDKILVLHFGMTGSIQYYKNENEKPGHTRMLIYFKNGYHLAYDCPRKLGKIFLIDDKQKFIEKKKLGPDPLSKEFNLFMFRKILDGKRGTIKSALMDQRTISGIGNIYSDEILFNAGIHPASKTEKLNDNQVKKIYHMINMILNKVIDANADEKRMPRTYLLQNRKAGGDCPRCSGKIRKKTIGGRSSYFCDKHQKK